MICLEHPAAMTAGERVVPVGHGAARVAVQRAARVRVVLRVSPAVQPKSAGWADRAGPFTIARTSTRRAPIWREDRGLLMSRVVFPVQPARRGPHGHVLALIAVLAQLCWFLGSAAPTV